MALKVVKKASVPLRIVVAILAALYICGVKSISSVMIGGVKLEIAAVELKPWMFAAAIAVLETLLAIDLFSGRLDRIDRRARDEEKHKNDDEAVKVGWSTPTPSERTGASTAAGRSALDWVAFGFLYLLPVLAGLYCLGDFLILFARS